MTRNLDDLIWTCDFTFIEIASGVIKKRKIRDLICDTKIISIKFEKEQSILKAKTRIQGVKSATIRLNG